MGVSKFYCACRDGDVDRVKALLSTLSTAEIDQMEPNGSTALHAAAFYGHIDIVRLLLRKGACPTQKNKYDATAEEEAKTPEIAQVFQRATSTENNEWTISDTFAATLFHRRFYSFSQGAPSLSDVVNKLLSADELWHSKDLTDDDRESMNITREYFKEALEHDDATQLISAYAIGGTFYRLLNKTLASYHELSDEEREDPPWFCAFARFLASDVPALRPTRWTGETYRGMQIPTEVTSQWQVGKMLMNKAFVTTATSQQYSKDFALQTSKVKHQSTLLTYTIKDDRAALNIASMSEYAPEGAVLILPCMDFEITDMKKSGQLLEITLLLR